MDAADERREEREKVGRMIKGRNPGKPNPRKINVSNPRQTSDYAFPGEVG